MVALSQPRARAVTREIHHYSQLTGEELYVARRLAALYGSRDGKGRPRQSSKPIRWDTIAVDALEALEEYREDPVLQAKADKRE